MATTADLDVTTFSIGESSYPFKLAEHVKVNKGDLNTEFASHAEIFAFYATAYELAKEQETRAKTHREQIAAQEDYKARQSLNDANMKYTEKMVENTVKSQQSYKDADAAYMDAQRNAGLLSAAVDALNVKRDMLISLGAMMRAEGGSDIHLNKKMEIAKKVLVG